MQESRVYSFLDSKNNFTIHFLEGQKLIVDLVQTHNLGPTALAYYRDTLLSCLHLLSYLKPGESIGFYIDSEIPYFRFKVELSDNGNFRTLLLPEQFDSFPEKLTGVCRITKVFPEKRPYTSIIQMNEQAPHDLINEVFKQSYQTNSEVLTSETTDQSIMVRKMPPANVNEVSAPDKYMALNEYILNKKKLFNGIFEKSTSDIEQIVKHFESDTFAYLGSKQLKLTCSCSKDRMITNIMSLSHNDTNEIFHEDNEIEVRCDYCNTVYQITREDIAGKSN